MQEEVQHSITWATALVLVVATIIAGSVLGGSFDHQFDADCINNNKSIVYTTLEGSDYAHKECK